MQIHRAKLAGAVGDEERVCHVYLAEAAGPNGARLVKVGMADNPLDRVSSLKTGCPFPISGFSYVAIGSRLAARDVEALIHRVFRRFRTSGEWFSFDLEDPEHRRVWSGGVSAVLNNKMGKGKWVLNRYNFEAHAEVSVANRIEAAKDRQARREIAKRRAKIFQNEDRARRRNLHLRATGQAT